MGKKNSKYGTNTSRLVLVVYFLDGNARTMRSWPTLDRKGRQAGIDYYKRYASKNESKIFYAIIYDNFSGNEIERIVEGDARKREIYNRNKKLLKP